MRVKNLIAFLRARLSREGFLGLHLTISILVLIGATWLFAAVAEDVITGDRITTIDTRFSGWLHAHSNASLTKFMLVVSALHATLSMIIAALAVSLVLWFRRLNSWLLTVALSVFGGILLNVLLKSVFQRSRPQFKNPIVTLDTYSFPSGHVLMATVFYGTLCALFVSRFPDWKWRLPAIGAAVALIILVGFSRMYLGAHYLSDVVGAMLEGVAWLTSCLLAVSLIYSVDAK